MAMRVDQAGQQYLFAQIENFAGMPASHVSKASDLRNLFSLNHDGAIIYRLALHRHDEA
jgi:hypothetical protein